MDDKCPTPKSSDLVTEFFKSVSADGYPEGAGMSTKAQPWRSIWPGPQRPSEDGKLLVACPKNCVYGKSRLSPRTPATFANGRLLQGAIIVWEGIKKF